MGIFLGALSPDPHWGTADVEIKILSFENRSLTIFLLSKRGAGQTIATHASPKARNVSLALISHLPLHSPSRSIHHPAPFTIPVHSPSRSIHHPAPFTISLHSPSQSIHHSGPFPIPVHSPSYFTKSSSCFLIKCICFG